MTTLIITLSTDSSSAAALWDYVLSPDGVAVAGQGSVPLGLLPGLPSSQTEVVAVVSAQALSWHQVQLPKGSLPRAWMAERSATRLRAILDGLLEDALLDDPEQLHLALQPQPHTDAPVWVAACDRAWLKTQLQTLAQAGYSVRRIVPEFTPDQLAHTCCVVGDDAHPLLVGMTPAASQGQPAGLVVLPLSVASVAWLAGQLSADLPESVVAEPAVAAQAESLFKRPVTLQQRPQRLLQAAQTGWDMAQFDLLNARRDRVWAQLAQGARSLAQAPQWRAARLALLALVLGNLVGLNAWALREQASLQAKRQAVKAVLTGTFPKIPVVVDAPLQMAREVSALQRASGSASGADLDAMLASFSALAHMDTAPTAIDYVAQELRIKVPPVSVDLQSQTLMALRQQGLAASWDGTQWVIKPAGAP
jgi:general secretion pathway protein L